MTNLSPLDDRIVIKPIANDTKTKQGIYLPESSVKKTNRGQVVAMGTGRVVPGLGRINMQVRLGDIVIFENFAGTEVQDGDDKLFILSEQSVLAVEGRKT